MTNSESAIKPIKPVPTITVTLTVLEYHMLLEQLREHMVSDNRRDPNHAVMLFKILANQAHGGPVTVSEPEPRPEPKAEPKRKWWEVWR